MRAEVEVLHAGVHVIDGADDNVAVAEVLEEPAHALDSSEDASARMYSFPRAASADDPASELTSSVLKARLSLTWILRRWSFAALRTSNCARIQPTAGFMPRTS